MTRMRDPCQASVWRPRARDKDEAGEGAQAERRARVVRQGRRCDAERGQAALGLMSRDMEVEKLRAVYHFVKRYVLLVVVQCISIDLFPLSMIALYPSATSRESILAARSVRGPGQPSRPGPTRTRAVRHAARDDVREHPAR
jgi:hypothetical protein